MKITIKDPGPPMWFFEDGDIKLHLTFVEGYNSEEIDLNQVSERGVAYLIGSTQGGQIETDMPLSDLWKHWRKLQGLPDEEKKADELTPEQRELQEKFISSEARRQARAEALEERCVNLAKSSYKALRAGLAGEDNQYIVVKVLRLEKAGKCRKTVIKFLEEKLQSLRHQKLKEANNALTSQPENFGVGDKPDRTGYNRLGKLKEGDIELVDFDIREIEIITEEDEQQIIQLETEVVDKPE